MGKTKPKYPVDIQIEFILPLNGQDYESKEVQFKIYSSPLKYQHIRKLYEQFLEETNIRYPTVMYYILDDDRYDITEDFQMEIPIFLEMFGGKFTIIIQNSLQAFMDQINFELQRIHQDIQEIKQKLNDIPTRQQIQLLKKTSIPALHHTQSTSLPLPCQQKQIDLGVLFSQPIFDEVRKKSAATPVDFRSEIQRLHLALKSSLKPYITLKCQIATKQNLKHLIKYSKPKILHIICHGTRQGSLQFEDDSRTIVGTLQMVDTNQIKQILKSVQDFLPDVVFINSCHSEFVGKIFFQMGVKYVIMIDSEDTIEDEAAQIFSQHFYRNIFSGQKVREAFKQAKQRVKMKHNSFGCCCRHSSRQKHKSNCRWSEMIRKRIPNTYIIDEQQKQQIHKLFHIPSQNCKCELKNLNRHKTSCEWARQSLFNINNDFRILDQNGNARFPKSKSQLPKYLPKDELVVCCCFNYEGPSENEGDFRLPHNQSNKFKILFSTENEKDESIFDITPSSYKQLVDYTATELMESHEKIEYSIFGRQKQIYDFMKRIKDLTQSVYLIHGRLGVGRTSFALKCVTYLIERRLFGMYFYIDLYGIKDKDIFRYKFNEITKFNYDGEIRINQIKNRAIIIILDNADEFFELQMDQLYDELKNLRQQLHKCKIIINLKSENAQTFDIEKIHSEIFFLEPLSIQVARRLLFMKMRHLFDLTVQDSEIDALIKSSESLRIPKMIESVCQSFSSSKVKIKVSDIKKKLEEFKDCDASIRIIEQNLNILKEKSQQSYQLLLFISQFAEGISMDDFKMLNYYDKKDSKIHLPIGKYWQTSFCTLFEKFKVQSPKNQSDESSINNDQQNHINMAPQLKNFHSIIDISHQKDPISEVKGNSKIIKGQSYFLDEVSQNRFIVKRYIRDFIWKKHISQSNYYMKHLFIGYMSVTLQVYFKWLVESKYIHEDLLEYSTISETGLFGFKNSIFNLTVNLSESMRFAQEYNSELERIIIEHPTVFQKIKKSDPSMFITNHKQDFLNIYQKSWDLVYNYLKDKKKKQQKVFIGYLQNLMIFIPTAFKIAKVENSLLKYIISKSMSLLNKLKVYSQQKKIIALQLKLQLMRASVDIQKTQIQTLKLDLDFNKQNTIKLLQRMDKSAIQLLKKSWNFQRNFILMYKQYINKKQSHIQNYNQNHKLFMQKSSKLSSEKLKIMIQNFALWFNQDWKFAEQKLAAKRNFLLSLVFLNILKNLSGNVSLHTTSSKMRKDYQKKIIQMVKDSATAFKNNDLMKLCLRAKITALELYTWQLNQKKKTNIGQTFQFYEELSQKQRQIIQCERIYTQRKNNLIAFAEFQIQIKNLKKLLKQKLWQMSPNTLVCMRAVPITINGQHPIIENLFRKKNKFRKQIQTVIDPHVDVCSKFQILTRQKLRQEVQNGCTILLLSASVKIVNGIPNLVFEGVRMDEDLIELNENFVSEFDMSKIKILIIAGKNSSVAITYLSKILQDPPIMISLGKKATYKELQNFKQFGQNGDLYKQNQYLTMIQNRKKAQLMFLKQFMRNLFQCQKITTKQQIVKLCLLCRQAVGDCIDVGIQYKKRQSPIEIVRMKGSYKDLSPGYQKNHNIDMKIKLDNCNLVVLRRWKETHRVFDYLTRCSDICQEHETVQPACINVFGDVGSGKTHFVHQIARILVEREKFSSGVFIIEGKLLEKKYQGEFEAYFQKQSESGRIITLQDFETSADQRFMLIIDDFDLIKPRSNGRFNLFMQKLIEKRVNLIIVTHEIYQTDFMKDDKKQNSVFLKLFKPFKIERLYPFEIDLIAYDILDLSNVKLLQKYQELKKSKKNNENLRVKEIIELKNMFYGKNNQNQFNLGGLGYFDEIKKMISNQL